ncbi:MAG: EAL domain-containing protein [Lachnospiraceae bacterium]|nr:EAL domain-containing protein [Lachnospiraceae bacterium]
MTVNIYFDIVALAMEIVLLACFKNKRRIGITAFRAFFYMMLTQFGVTFLGICTAVIGGGLDSKPGVFGYTLNTLYMFLCIFLFTMSTLYFISLIKIDRQVSQRWLIWIYLPASFTIIAAVAVNVISAKMELSLFEIRSIPFSQGYILVMAAYYMLIITGVSVRYRDRINKKITGHVALASLIIMFITVAQFFINTMRFQGFVVSMVLVDLFFEVLRPEELFDMADAMRKNYLYEFTKEDYLLKKKFHLTIIKVLDYKVLAESLGFDNAEGFMKLITNYLMGYGHKGTVYRADNSVLVFKTSELTKEEAEKLRQTIVARFEKVWSPAITEAILTAEVVSLSAPEQLKDFDAFSDFLKAYINTKDRLDSENGVEKLLIDNKGKHMLEAIKRALTDNTFQVYYQPIYSTEEKRIMSAEALIRLFDPEYGFMPPEEMIKMAESEGYILRIGEIVFRKVCEFYRDNELDKKGIEYIEVNLSPIQCAQRKMAEEFEAIMKEYGIKPKQINFEITETATTNEKDNFIRNMKNFYLRGIDLSLDDYGTGYSNISYLYHVPFTVMKIDKSILWSAEKNEKARITLENTYKLAKKLRLKVVQEGVENEEQIKRLLELKCDYFQGYYFSKPVKGEEFVKYLKDFKLPEVCK